MKMLRSIFILMQGRLNIAWHLAISFFWICVFLRKCVYIVIKDSVLKISLQTLKYILLFMQDRGVQTITICDRNRCGKGVCVNPSPITEHASLSVSGLRSRHYRAKGSKFLWPKSVSILSRSSHWGGWELGLVLKITTVSLAHCVWSARQLLSRLHLLRTGYFNLNGFQDLISLFRQIFLQVLIVLKTAGISKCMLSPYNFHKPEKSLEWKGTFWLFQDTPPWPIRICK